MNAIYNLGCCFMLKINLLFFNCSFFRLFFKIKYVLMLSTGAFFCALGRFCAPEHFLRPGALGALGRGDEIFAPAWGVGAGR